MSSNTETLIGMAVLALAGLIAFGVYTWLQARRVQRVERWVKEYLTVRFGETPKDVRINCSNDRQWPVLVEFDAPRTGVRHNLQFMCSGPCSTYALFSEKHERV